MSAELNELAEREGDHARCRCCSAAIDSAELCEKCAAGNDPFLTSKYSDGARP